MQKIFHAPQEKKTIEDYADMGGRFLCFCLRSMQDLDLRWNWDYPFTDEQRRILTELSRLVATSEGDVSSQDWCPVIHWAFKSFVNCEEVKKSVEEVKWALYRFLICASINSSGDRFNDPADVPHIVKKLGFCIRVNIFEQARRMDNRDEDRNDGDTPGEMKTLDSDGGLFGLKRYVIDDGQTLFNSIRYVSNLANQVASDEGKIGFVEWKVDPEHPEKFDILVIRNKSFPFSRLLSFVDGLLTKTDRSLFLDILGGIKLPDKDLLIYEPMEALNNHKHHSSAFREPVNMYVEYESYLIDGWLKDTRKRETVLKDVSLDEIQWKRGSILRWLDKCKDYLEQLFVLLQVIWRGPARLTEMTSLRITNGQHKRRNVYFDGGWIMILFRYNKT